MGSRGFNLDEYLNAVGFGLVPGIRRVAALGNNPDVDQASVPEDVWSFGGLYPWMTAATSLEVVSTSASDTAAGTGARTVTIFGLDVNYVEINQTITLNGTTAVAVPTQIFRINSVLMMSAGSNKINVGDIHVRDAGAGTVRAHIASGVGITRQVAFTVPAAHTLSIHSSVFAITAAGGVDKNITMANFIQSPNGFFRMPFAIAVSQVTPYRHDGIPGIILAEKTDYSVRVTDASASDVGVTAAWLGILKQNQMP